MSVCNPPYNKETSQNLVLFRLYMNMVSEHRVVVCTDLTRCKSRSMDVYWFNKGEGIFYQIIEEIGIDL